MGDETQREQQAEPGDSMDAVIAVYMKDVDRTLLRENLKLTVEERIRKAQNFHKVIDELRASGRRLRASDGKENDK